MDADSVLELERQASLARYLAATAEVAVALSMADLAGGLADAAPVVLPAVGRHLGWPLGAIWEFHDHRQSLFCAHVWVGETADFDAFVKASFDSDLAVGQGVPGKVASTGEPLWVVDVADTGYPRAILAREVGLYAAFGFPIFDGDEMLGVIEFFSEQRAPADPDLLRAMATIGRHVGQFLGRRRAERDAVERSEFLARATGALDATLDYEEALQRLAVMTVPFLADACTVDMVDGDVVRRVAVSIVDPAKERLMLDARLTFDLSADQRVASLTAIRTGETQILQVIDDATRASISRDDDHHALLSAIGLRAGIVVPLRARDRVIGAVSFGLTEPTRTFGPREIRLAQELAQRASLAIDNARLFTERSYIARRLQQDLLPPSLPSLPGLDIAVRYLPAGEDTDIGGDFYDVFAGPDGWVFAVGDVCGKGVEAAALTGLVRNALRALSLHDTDGVRTLHDLNTVLLHERTGERFCTVCHVVLRSGPDGLVATVTTAGHPLPALVRANGSVTHIGEAGTLVGVLADIEVNEVTVPFGLGDSLALYTDGVLERRSDRELYGQRRMDSVLRRCAGQPAAEIAEELERSVVAFDWRAPRDDMAILVVNHTGVAAT